MTWNVELIHSVYKVEDIVCREMRTNYPKRMVEYLPHIMPCRNFRWMVAIDSEARRLVVESILSLDKDSSNATPEGSHVVAFDDDVAGAINLDFFFEVLDRCRDLISGRNLIERSCCASPSIAVARFVAVRRSNECAVCSEVFGKLTSEYSLPRVAPAAALQLLVVESEFDNSAEGGNEDQVQITSLQKRCIRGLSNGSKSSSSSSSSSGKDFLMLETALDKFKKCDVLKLLSLSLLGTCGEDDEVEKEQGLYTGPHHVYVFSGEFRGSYKTCNKTMNNNMGTLRYENSKGAMSSKVYGIWEKQVKWYVGHKPAATDGWIAAYNSPSTVAPAASTIPPSWGWVRCKSVSSLPPLHLMVRKGVESGF